MKQDAVAICRVLLNQKDFVTIQDIENSVDIVLRMPGFSDLDRERLVHELEASYSISILQASILRADRPIPWIKAKKSQIGFNFWNRYLDYLRYDKQIPDSVLYQLDRITDETLDGLFDPSWSNSVNKLGMVVGQVQSGKTSNYTGLICKAADAGYKIIIVLAGIHNSLRSQTQLRIDEGFLGFNTQFQQAYNQGGIRIGVGKFSTPKDSVAHSLTSSVNNGDFSSARANGLGINFNTEEPIIAVVKKNVHILQRIISWLMAHAVKDVDGNPKIENKSLLLIDDEADYASINVNPLNGDRTAINRNILKILSLFAKKGYVGYTATPFANIFIPIDSDDLFPKDFIINIPAPSNYIGPEKLFNTENLENYRELDSNLPLVNCITDYSTYFPSNHKKDDPLPNDLPESLKLAIKCFIITCAVRRLRGQSTSHNSMLIHVTRFVRWQGRITELVNNTLHQLKNAIDLRIPETISEFRKVFEENADLGNGQEYLSYINVSKTILESEFDVDAQIHDWGAVEPHLNAAVQKISVREINGGSGEVLNYVDNQKEGLSIIAIGGDKLSRGLTLEGLSISYYLRASKMYDTLMQMGRWFGYRAGYVDLCRLFTSTDLNEWFSHITIAAEELRQEFDYMTSVAGSNPANYALRVRSHPGVLQISASNKIRNTVTFQISWSSRLVESYQLSTDPDILDSNLKATNSLVNSLGPNYSDKKKCLLWEEIPFSTIQPFMQTFQVANSLVRAQPANLLRYIEKQISNGELINWNVALMKNRKPENYHELKTDYGILKLGLFVRTNAKDRTDSNEKTYFIKKNHIISPEDESLDLTPEEMTKAMELTLQNKPEYKYSYPTGDVVRAQIRSPKKPLLLLYHLDSVKSKLEDVALEFPAIVGFAISFPKSEYNIPVGYVVNGFLLDKFNEDFEFEDSDYE